MKTTFLTAATLFCIAGAGSLQAQTASQPDSIRVQIVKNINGNELQIDTAVPVAQQQSLMTWLSSQGIEMTIPGIPGDTMLHKMIMITMDGDSMNPNSSMRMIPPPPKPGEPAGMKRMMVISDENGETQVITLPPAVPQLPGAPPAPPAMPSCPAKGENTTVIVMRDSTGKETVIHKQVIIMDSKDGNAPQSPAAPPAPALKKAGSDGNEINVYPNPTEGHITLSFHLEGTGKTNIRITDMNGKIVYEEQLGEAYSAPYSKEIDLGGGKGMYTIEVRKGDNVLVRKVMVQ